MDVEHGLICSAVRSRDLKPALDGGVTPDFFEDDEHRRVWLRMLDLWTEHSQVPSAKALKRDFPNYKFIEPEDTYSFFVEAIREAREWAIATETLAAAATLVRKDKEEKGRPDAEPIVEALRSGIRKLDIEVATVTAVDLVVTGDDRLARYDDIASSPGRLTGISTGFDRLDFVTSGFQDQQLITLTGEPKAGKSTTMMKWAIAAHEDGYTPLFFSFEMSNEEQYMRHDAMRAGMDDRDLKYGKLSPKQRKHLAEVLKDLEEMHPFILSESNGAMTTVSGLAAQIERHEPDIVFVDGVYLMTDEEGEPPGTPRALTNITRNLKRLAQRRKLPLVCSTQTLTWKLNRRKGTTGDAIGYTSSFVQDSDLVAAVENTDDEEIKKLRIVMARSAPQMVMGVRWDWKTGTFEELDEDEFDEEDDDDYVPGD